MALFDLGLTDRLVGFASSILRGIRDVLLQGELPSVVPPAVEPAVPGGPSTFNPLLPSTFGISKPSLTGGPAPQTSNYAYTVQVNPVDPASYRGVPFITISTNELMTEDQILGLAAQYVSQYTKFGGSAAIESLTLVGGQMNRDFAISQGYIGE